MVGEFVVAVIKYKNFEFTINESDILLKEDYFSGYCSTLWVAHDHGFVIGAVVSNSENDALDELADEGLLDSFLYEEEEGEDEKNVWERLNFLGNDGKPYDIEGLETFSLSLPPPSMEAQLERLRLNP